MKQYTQIVSRVVVSLGIVLVVTIFAACTDRTNRSDEDARMADLSSVAEEVERAVWAFHAADTTMDAEAVIGLLWPEYHMLVDGTRLEYDDVVTGTREFMATLEFFSTEWTDLRITPLDEDHAVASFQFRDSIRTTTGELLQSRGPTTFIWQRRNREWRVIFADADHYPLKLAGS